MLLDHHDRAVHDEAEVDGAEAHQVPGDPENDHGDRRPQHRQGNRDRHQQAGAEAPQGEQQNADDEEAALEQVLADRPQRVVNEDAAVVNDVQTDVGRQHGPNGRHPLVDGRHHVEGVRASEHLGHQVDRLSASIRGCGPDPEQRIATDLRDVGDADGPPARRAGRDDRHGEVGCVAWEGRGAQECLCPGAGWHASTRGAPGRPHQRRLQSVERQAALGEPDRIGDHVEGAPLPAPGVHLHDALHASHERSDLVLRKLQELRRRARLGAEREMKDLAEPARQGPELRHDPFGEDAGEVVQALLDDLASAVRVDCVGEDRGDGRDPVAGDAPVLSQPR